MRKPTVTGVLGAIALIGSLVCLRAEPNRGSGFHEKHVPKVLASDPRVHVEFGDEMLVLEEGLQPSLLITRTGAMIVQAQVAHPSIKTKRFSYPAEVGTVISRDDGATWTRLPLKPAENGLNLEGGGIQLRDGTVLALDTYVVPSGRAGEGVGQIYVSSDDWMTVEGPIDVPFHLPGVNFHGSSDDVGRPYDALRLHRRILELPNGALLTTAYGWMEGDTTPSAYMNSMKKTRALLLRSNDHGRHWNLESTIAVDPQVGTEGFDEPVIARVSSGEHAGRLICQMRTGQELRETFSDDDGKTWAPAYPRVYANLDVHRTEMWAEMFRDVKDKNGKLISANPTEFIGAVVDPDLIELRSGVLVASFGVRIPPRACWPRAGHPWNGNYLAISIDHGATWSHVVRMTSGVLTTHYTAIAETPRDNRIFFAYDLGDWSSGRGRSAHGRFVTIKVDAP